MVQSRKQFFIITTIFFLIVSIGLAAIVLNAGILTSDSNIEPSPSATPSATPTPTPTDTPAPTEQPHTDVTPAPTNTLAATSTPTDTPAPTPKPTEKPVPTPSAMPTPDPALIVFGDNFQSGNISAWTSTDTSGVNLSVKNSMLQCQTQSVTNGSWGYLYKWFDHNYTSINWQWYLYFGNLPATDGNTIGAGGIYNSAVENNFNPAYSVCSLAAVCQNGVYHWQLHFTNTTQFYNLTSPQTVQANTWYLVELKAIQGAGNGEAHFYLNNAETLNATGLTNNNNPGIDHVSIGGGITADLPITWYCGGAVVAQTYVGPEPSTSPTAIATALGSTTFNLYTLIAAGVLTLISILTLLLSFAVSADQKMPVLHAKLVE